MEIKFNFDFSVKRKYVVDGKEYASIEEMPPEVQEKFRIAKARRLGPGSSTRLPGPGLPLSLKAGEDEGAGPTPGQVLHEPIKPEPTSSFSSLWLIVALLALIALFGFYYLLNSAGAR